MAILLELRSGSIRLLIMINQHEKRPGEVNPHSAYRGEEAGRRLLIINQYEKRPEVNPLCAQE